MQLPIVILIKSIISDIHHHKTYMYINFQQNRANRSVRTVHTNVFATTNIFFKIDSQTCIIVKVLEKCTKNLIGHSRLAFNNHESNIDC